MVDRLPHASPAVRSGDSRFYSPEFAPTTGVAITTLDGRFLEVNPAYCDILGYSPAELSQTDELSITYPDDRVGSREALRHLLGEGVPAVVLEKRYRRKDERVAWVQENISVLRDSQGCSSNLLALCQDISPYKEAEQALRKDQEYLHALLQAAPSAIITLDTHGNVVTWNPAA